MPLFPTPLSKYRSNQSLAVGQKPKRRRWLSLAMVLPALVILAVLAVVLLRGQPQHATAQPATSQPAVVLQGAPTTPPEVTTVVPATPPTTQPATQPAVSWQDNITQGLRLLGEGKSIEARTLLSAVYFEHYTELPPRDAQAIRDTLSSVNQDLVFGKDVKAGDPVSEYYEIQPNDMLLKIGAKFRTPYAFLEQINKTEAKRIQAGKKLKVVRGPFHVIVHKSEFRLDVYLNDPAGKPVFVTSFPVGLGLNDSTPVGSWAIALDGKVANPAWTDPASHRTYASNDPANPIGKFWIGLQGTDADNQTRTGYGIHGTIEPDSIGKQMSHGCIRLRNEDVAQLFKLVYERWSTVKVLP